MRAGGARGYGTCHAFMAPKALHRVATVMTTWKGDTMAGILWTIAAIVVVIWLLGFIFDVAGNLIHLLLVIAVIVIAWNLITGRRAV